ncbi:autotransporter domain-containing protein [Actimicrobium sp. CCC2.4]|uniref:autotransporter outer membrane beta-barrel domain-containing protein n=1 Tax=Actimicrobium sp. CCC2.4 TaxID=3048606 RepID=UPI002AC8FE65|nr:autotransporter domain-containing protein [Actimicrobium sp. CCC2.4]MEB0135822.1 autotransporter domain-containing protein [Actimicrobium sp. CCC2.4]WPX33301.1 autotransporter domain-containing protein [Actimicrobium sp. CCC2.4]
MNLVPGAYTFTYIPISSPSQDWNPIDTVIRSSGFTITSQQLANPSNPGVPVSNPINTAVGSYSSTSLATTTTPNFTGGTLTLASSTPSLAQNFTIGQAGGTLNQNGNETTISGALSNASASTPGSLTIANTGTGGRVSLSGVNTFTGATTINSGATLALAGTGSISDSTNTLVNGTLNVSATTAGAAITSLAGTGAVVLGGQTLTLTNAAGEFAGSIGGSGALVIAGGTETLSGINTHTGGTVVTNNARLSVASDQHLGDTAGALTMNQGTLNSSASFTLARGVNLVGTGILDTATSTTLAASGPISGNGLLQKNGSGTLALLGDNSGMTGGMAINAGVVELGAANAAGSGAIALNSGVLHTTVDQQLAQALTIAGGTTIATDANTTTLLVGTVTSGGGLGCFIKSGAGALNMAAAATLNQGTCVQAGTLRANSLLDSTFVQVDADATLRGTGTIQAPITVAGTLAPGNSPGTLTTGSTVTMANGSTFQEDINGTGIASGPGNYSRLLVTGSNSQFIIGSSTLMVNLTKITGAVAYTPYVPQIGESFRIITADGGIVGRFANFAQPDGLAAGTRIALFYDVDATHSLDLRILPVSYAATVQSAGGTTNTVAAAALVDRAVNADQANGATARQTLLAATVTTVEAGRIDGVMRSLSGEVHAAVMAAVPSVGQAVQAGIARQLTLPREKALWTDLNGSRSRTSGDDAASGFKADRLQLTVGVDVFRNDTSRLGVGISQAHDNLSANAGSGTLNQTMAFVYADHNLGEVTLDGVAGFGRSLYSTRRADVLSNAALSGDTRGRNAMFGLGLQGAANVAGIDVKPFVRALWQQVRRSAYTEDGGSVGAIGLAKHDARGTRVMTGLTALCSGSAAAREPQAGVSTWQTTVGIGADAGSLIRPVLAAQLAGDDMTIVTPNVGRTFLQANLSGSLQQGKHTRLFYGVVGEVRSGRSDATINGGVQVAF